MLEVVRHGVDMYAMDVQWVAQRACAVWRGWRRFRGIAGMGMESQLLRSQIRLRY